MKNLLFILLLPLNSYSQSVIGKTYSTDIMQVFYGDSNVYYHVNDKPVNHQITFYKKSIEILDLVTDDVFIVDAKFLNKDRDYNIHYYHADNDDDDYTLYLDEECFDIGLNWNEEKNTYDTFYRFLGLEQTESEVKPTDMPDNW